MIRPLDRLRLRLTAWYAATFGLILVLLGGGLFLTIRSQMSRHLDDSLRLAVGELMRAARIRELEARTARGAVVDAVDELHVPDRALYLLATDGSPVKPPVADAWIEAAARTAAQRGSVDLEVSLAGRRLRLHAERFTVPGRTYVGAAVADVVELEDQYAALIGAFGAAALAGLVLVAAGGWLLVRKSTGPVEASMETMRRFMADAAHELRTPITVLRSQAEVALQRERDAEGYAAALRRVESEAERLGATVEDLLTLARADAGERPVERRRVFLDDLALDAASGARALATKRGVALEVGTFEEAVVTGDPALLRQLLMIVLDNAVKFTPGGGRVRVSAAAPSGQAEVVVEDTGVGIPAEQLPHVFDRFYRGDPARARGNGAEGAGLGLAIARWIAEAHGARIDVTSEPGKGTRVAIRFPAAAGEAFRS
ncbi:MAG TPA: HAMP domain-containing sensor histidine kinase [Gemmatimonadales bacterium]|nr:HAMP domain-containing sensor histidine kinase [Gemmatimonadales bacterium]